MFLQILVQWYAVFPALLTAFSLSFLLKAFLDLSIQISAKYNGQTV